MGIESIDKNFIFSNKISEETISYKLPCEPFEIYGVFYDENLSCFLRMNDTVAKNVSDGVHYLNKHTSGGRIKFATDSNVIEIEVCYDEFTPMPHMTLVASAGCVLSENTKYYEKLIGFCAPNCRDNKGYKASFAVKGNVMSDYVLYLPLYNSVSSLTISLKKGAKISKGKKYRNIAPILYAGSSITQGGCSSRPDTCYPAHICRWNNIDYLNLGFSGNFKAEVQMADYLSSINCSLFVYDYDHNAPSAEYLNATHFALYEKFRKAQPNTPIIMISRPDGRRADDGDKRFKIIQKSYDTAKSFGDENVYLIDGRTFYEKNDYEFCSVDGCHPNDLGFYKIAKKIYKKMIEIDKKFR